MDLEQIRTIYASSAASYDRMMGLQEPLFLGKLRRALLYDARGKVLEAAIGTGLSLPHYPPGCQLVGLDATAETLAIAELRAQSLGLRATLLVGDAEHLPFPDQAFDTVVSMLSGCTFPHPIAAFGEMRRVCKRDGQVLLLEHVRINRPLIGRFQDLITPLTVRRHGCHQNRNTAANVEAAGLQITVRAAALGGYLLSVKARP